jgi:hypothetical protein
MKLLLTIGLIIFSLQSFAQRSPTAADYSMAGLEFGFKSNTASIANSTSNKQENGFQLGVSGVYNIGESFGLKSGLMYSERPFSADFALTSSKGKITYFEIPLQFMLKFEEYAGVYVGPSISLKMSDEGSPAGLANVKSMIVPLTIGAQFKFLPNLGANVFFETVSGELATNVENSRAVGVNLIITLD